jgi:AcrR family transcriptional regulator
VSVTLNEERTDLRSRKQKLVHDAILDAALALFQDKGFDETTVEDIAQAAGVSKRSFFRYYAAKDDLLAKSVIEYGHVLADAIRSAPKGASDVEVIDLTLLAGVRHNERPETRARQFISISAGNETARQAYLSRKHVVEDAIAHAFAARQRGAKRDDLRVRVLAGITLTLMNATISAWFLGKEKTLQGSARSAQAELRRIIVGDGERKVASSPKKGISGSHKSTR